MNHVYYGHFSGTTPVRSLIIADFVTPKMMIEIEVIAHVETK
jgi:enamine deaminase RidA (YjgF/YER057c/UK114 family)